MSKASPPAWCPRASLEILQLRAQLLAQIRRFFAARAVWEVETPQLSPAAASDPQLHSFTTTYTGPGAAHGQALFLHTSPEFPMKRLLAAGSGSIYQICKVFRDGEAGRLHNPEFTLVEWYRVGWNHHQLMDEVAELVITLLDKQRSVNRWEKLSYPEAFQRHTGLDPLNAPVSALANYARTQGISTDLPIDHAHMDAWRDLLLTHCVEPQLGQGSLTFLYDYPASQAALARLKPDRPALAERFELYLDGVELANGFHELGDATEQAHRFAADNLQRQRAGLASVPLDKHLLAALEAGLPDCAGVAIGFDRLAMLASGARSLAEVLAFPIERA